MYAVHTSTLFCLEQRTPPSCEKSTLPAECQTTIEKIEKISTAESSFIDEFCPKQATQVRNFIAQQEGAQSLSNRCVF